MKKNRRIFKTSVWLCVFFLLGAGLSYCANSVGVESDFERERDSFLNKARQEDLRIQAIDRMAETDSYKLFPLLIDALNDGENSIFFRSTVAEKLVELNSMRAKGVFENFLADPNADSVARRIAVFQLSEINDSSFRNNMVRILNDTGEDAAIRQYVLGVYAREKTPQKLLKVREIARNPTETLGMRMNAMSILETWGDLDFLKPLLRGFIRTRQTPEELRKYSVATAKRLWDQEAVTIMLDAAMDPYNSPDFRRLVLAVLEEMGDSAMTLRLKTKLREEGDPDVRTAIREAINVLEQTQKT
ncbi:MAG TPA: HEAT repeat domain-containing protein [Candidatus Omnitrophota bacterium]|nr:HEAT repeat domain-containing protein [Candidatus Omnitrophota bacterium]